MTTVYLVRHGETVHNEGGQGLGREDAPLTAVGEAQMREVAARFHGRAIQHILTSPLSRAALMAEAIGGAVSIAPEPRAELIELDVGETEGITFAEMRERFPDFMKAWEQADPTDVVMPGGESLRDLAARTELVAEELRTTEQAEVVVVAHNFVIKILLCQLLQLPLPNFRRFQIDLASVSTLSVRGGRVAVVSLNDICHVETLSIA